MSRGYFIYSLPYLTFTAAKTEITEMYAKTVDIQRIFCLPSTKKKHFKKSLYSSPLLKAGTSSVAENRLGCLSSARLIFFLCTLLPGYNAGLLGRDLTRVIRQPRYNRQLQLFSNSLIL
jgi:hypothetical protein